MSNSPVIGAIDLGYGYTKYSVRTEGAAFQDSFPSFAPTASGSQALDAHGALPKLHVVENGDPAQPQPPPAGWLRSFASTAMQRPPSPLR